ncbi:uncharacterized protein CMC5_029750 [Chondromyces crocatus]|uniref:Secreted protein n=1 Tax=Chondromyces crocatus TaxID=52 RepID=A0A0K1EDA4_CHOCO|nr:uncharacterized protein CMC5_029750 [Chondromyces crocatus]
MNPARMLPQILLALSVPLLGACLVETGEPEEGGDLTAAELAEPGDVMSEPPPHAECTIKCLYGSCTGNVMCICNGPIPLCTH